MPTFEYQAQGADGRLVTGLVFGASLDHVARQLAEQGMQVTRIGLAANANDPLAAPAVERPTRLPTAPAQPIEVPRPLEGSPIAGPPVEQRSYVATSVLGPLVGKVGLAHIQFFFQQLSTMLEAGVPYVQSLDTLSRQSQSPKLRSIIRELKGHVEAGRPISAGLQRYPEVFSPVVVSLVRAGEQGGFLDQALQQVATYLEKEIQLRNLYKRVTFYPKLQLAASVLIILAANAIIRAVGGSNQLSSPLTSWTTWMWLAPLIVGVFLFFRVGLANHAVKHVWDAIATNIPFIGGTMRQLAMAKFGRAFGALYRGGVPMSQAMTLAADACGNEWLRAQMYPAYRKLESGAGVTETLKSTGAFNPIVIDMVDTGERTGNLDHMLGKMADFYEGEAEVRSIQTGHVIGVLVFLLVAIYIGFIVISFWGGYGRQFSDAVGG